jgi:hypothetical protein
MAKRRKKVSYVFLVYALTGFSVEIFIMKKNPSASMTVRTDSAYIPLGSGYAHG